jgi:hypothetical protein
VQKTKTIHWNINTSYLFWRCYDFSKLDGHAEEMDIKYKKHNTRCPLSVYLFPPYSFLQLSSIITIFNNSIFHPNLAKNSHIFTVLKVHEK